jgi:hypothetical protein
MRVVMWAQEQRVTGAERRGAVARMAGWTCWRLHQTPVPRHAERPAGGPGGENERVAIGALSRTSRGQAGQRHAGGGIGTSVPIPDKPGIFGDNMGRAVVVLCSHIRRAPGGGMGSSEGSAGRIGRGRSRAEVHRCPGSG